MGVRGVSRYVVNEHVMSKHIISILLKCILIFSVNILEPLAFLPCFRCFLYLKRICFASLWQFQIAKRSHLTQICEGCLAQGFTLLGTLPAVHHAIHLLTSSAEMSRCVFFFPEVVVPNLALAWEFQCSCSACLVEQRWNKHTPVL